MLLILAFQRIFCINFTSYDSIHFWLFWIRMNPKFPRTIQVGQIKTKPCRVYRKQKPSCKKVYQIITWAKFWLTKPRHDKNRNWNLIKTIFQVTSCWSIRPSRFVSWTRDEFLKQQNWSNLYWIILEIQKSNF